MASAIVAEDARAWRAYVIGDVPSPPATVTNLGPSEQHGGTEKGYLSTVFTAGMADPDNPSETLDNAEARMRAISDAMQLCMGDPDGATNCRLATIPGFFNPFSSACVAAAREDIVNQCELNEDGTARIRCISSDTSVAGTAAYRAMFFVEAARYASGDGNAETGEARAAAVAACNTHTMNRNGGNILSLMQYYENDGMCVTLASFPSGCDASGSAMNNEDCRNVYGTDYTGDAQATFYPRPYFEANDCRTSENQTECDGLGAQLLFDAGLGRCVPITSSAQCVSLGRIWMNNACMNPTTGQQCAGASHGYGGLSTDGSRCVTACPQGQFFNAALQCASPGSDADCQTVHGTDPSSSPPPRPFYDGTTMACRFPNSDDECVTVFSSLTILDGNRCRTALAADCVDPRGMYFDDSNPSAPVCRDPTNGVECKGRAGVNPLFPISVFEEELGECVANPGACNDDRNADSASSFNCRPPTAEECMGIATSMPNRTGQIFNDGDVCRLPANGNECRMLPGMAGHFYESENTPANLCAASCNDDRQGDAASDYSCQMPTAEECRDVVAVMPGRTGQIFNEGDMCRLPINGNECRMLPGMAGHFYESENAAADLCVASCNNDRQADSSFNCQNPTPEQCRDVVAVMTGRTGQIFAEGGMCRLPQSGTECRALPGGTGQFYDLNAFDQGTQGTESAFANLCVAACSASQEMRNPGDSPSPTMGSPGPTMMGLLSPPPLPLNANNDWPANSCWQRELEDCGSDEFLNAANDRMCEAPSNGLQCRNTRFVLRNLEMAQRDAILNMYYFESGVCRSGCNDDRVPDGDFSCQDPTQADCSALAPPEILPATGGSLCQLPEDGQECAIAAGDPTTAMFYDDSVTNNCATACSPSREPRDIGGRVRICQDRQLDDCADGEYIDETNDRTCSAPTNGEQCRLAKSATGTEVWENTMCASSCETGTDRVAPLDNDYDCRNPTEDECSARSMVADEKICRPPRSGTECGTATDNSLTLFIQASGNCAFNCFADQEPDNVGTCMPRELEDCEDNQYLDVDNNRTCRSPQNGVECREAKGATGDEVYNDGTCIPGGMCPNSRVVDMGPNSDYICRDPGQEACTMMMQVLDGNVCRDPRNGDECRTATAGNFYDDGVGCVDECPQDPVTMEPIKIRGRNNDCRFFVENDCGPGEVFDSSNPDFPRCRLPENGVECRMARDATGQEVLETVLGVDVCRQECLDNRQADSNNECRNPTQEDCSDETPPQVIDDMNERNCRNPANGGECDTATRGAMTLFDSREGCVTQCPAGRAPGMGDNCEDLTEAHCPSGQFFDDEDVPAECRDPGNGEECRDAQGADGTEVYEDFACADQCREGTDRQMNDRTFNCEEPSQTFCSRTMEIAAGDLCRAPETGTECQNAGAGRFYDEGSCVEDCEALGKVVGANNNCQNPTASSCRQGEYFDDDSAPGECRAPASGEECREAQGADGTEVYEEENGACGTSCMDSRVAAPPDFNCANPTPEQCLENQQIADGSRCRDPMNGTECGDVGSEQFYQDGSCVEACDADKVERLDAVCEDRMAEDCNPGQYLDVLDGRLCRAPRNGTECRESRGASGSEFFENGACAGGCEGNRVADADSNYDCQAPGQNFCSLTGEIADEGGCRRARNGTECGTVTSNALTFYDAGICVEACPSDKEAREDNVCSPRQPSDCGAGQFFDEANGRQCRTPTNVDECRAAWRATGAELFDAGSCVLSCPDGRVAGSDNTCLDPLPTPSGRVYDAAACEAAGWVARLAHQENAAGERLSAEFCDIPVMVVATNDSRPAVNFSTGPLDTCVLRNHDGYRASQPRCGDERLFGDRCLPPMPAGFDDAAGNRLVAELSRSGPARIVFSGAEVPCPAPPGDDDDGSDLERAVIGGTALVGVPLAGMLIQAVFADVTTYLPSLGYQRDGNEDIWRYGGRVEHRGANWRSYASAIMDGESGGMAYESGARYDGGFWAASYAARETEAEADYDLSLSSEWNAGMWRLSPRGQVSLSRSQQSAGEYGGSLDMRILWRSHKWEIRPRGGLAWNPVSGSSSTPRVRVDVERKF